MNRTNKYNYIEIVNKMVPEVYRTVDYREFGSEEDISITFLGKILKAAVESNIFFSAIPDTTGGTFTLDELAEYFVPSNKKTRLSPQELSNKVLGLYGYNYDSFKSTSALHHFFSGTFLPDAELGNPAGLFAVMDGLGDGMYPDIASVNKYLIETLGMFYFMNTSSMVGDTGSTLNVAPSSLITEAILGPIQKGFTVTDKDAIETLFSYFWYNREHSTFCKSFIPLPFASGISDISALTYSSGLQQLSAVHIHLNTWTDDMLKDHTFLRDSLNVIMGGGSYPEKMRDAGSFQRLLKAISLGIADISLILEEIGDLLSIDECPDRFLDLLANNIGWIFITGEYSKWRAQLKNAVLVYKSKGSMLGMEAAFKLIFPTGMFSASDLTEVWESYLPRLIYYLVKTESFIAKNGSWFDPIDQLFPGYRPDVKFNQSPQTQEDSKDRNCRFMVDAILENIHNQYNNIKINGRDFRELPLWTCLPEGNRGFRHRNYPNDNPSPPYLVSIPPWEKYGFYKGVDFGPDEINLLCKTLSGSRENFGFEVGVQYVDALRTMLDTAMDTVYALSGVPEYSDNNKFLFFTSSHELPPNYAKFVKYGNTATADDFDLWNTRSSHIFTTMSLSNIDNVLSVYDSYKNRSSIQVYTDVLKEFLPLHVTARVQLYHDMEDDSCIGDTLCVIDKDCINTFNLGTLNSFRTKFFAGASGTGTFTSEVNADGRVLPKVDSEFWDYTADNLDRTASRRRNYRYSLPCYPFTRNGKGMPIAVSHYPFATVASQPDLGGDPYLNTWEYILKGFDYTTQQFEPPSSVVWDSSGYFSGGGICYPSGLEAGGSFSLSDTYPVRAVPEDPSECSALPFHRDNLEGILKVITSKKLRLAEKNTSGLIFGDLDYRSFPFGDSMHRSYHKYITEFGGALRDNSVSAYYNYGGHNFISYTYGPTIWNNDFRYKGKIIDNTLGSAPTSDDDPHLFDTYESQWSSVVGGTDSSGTSYVNLSGTLVVIGERTYFGNAPESFDSTSLSGVFYTTDALGSPIYSTREILSGLEFRQVGEECNGFAVVSTRGDSHLNTVRDYAITFYSKGVGDIELVVLCDPGAKFDRGFNRLRSQSEFKLETFTRTTNPAYGKSLNIELITSGLLDIYDKPITWGFNWTERKWEVYKDSNKFVLRQATPQGNDCFISNTATFNTYDSNTVKSIPCTDPFFIGDVHTSSTGYLLKIRGGPDKSENLEGVTLYGISILDKSLNKSIDDFNSNETYEIFKYWDTLAGGDFSRTPENITNTIFGAEGGGRGEYLELLGGSVISSSGFNFGTGTKLDYFEYVVED